MCRWGQVTLYKDSAPRKTGRRRGKSPTQVGSGSDFGVHDARRLRRERHRPPEARQGDAARNEGRLAKIFIRLAGAECSRGRRLDLTERKAWSRTSNPCVQACHAGNSSSRNRHPGSNPGDRTYTQLAEPKSVRQPNRYHSRIRCRREAKTMVRITPGSRERWTQRM